MVKLPSQMATWLSPNGSVKKHNLYSKHPRAWKRKPRVTPVTHAVTHKCKGQRNKLESTLVSQHIHSGLYLRSLGHLTHPNIGFCGDNLVVVKIHHLRGSI